MQQKSLSRVEEFAQDFELAFSFNELMRDTAKDLWFIAESLGFRSYFYTEELVRQSGIQIERLRQEIYAKVDTLIVDSNNYGKTDATWSELKTIRARLDSNAEARVILVRYQVSKSDLNTLNDYVVAGSPQVIVVELDNRMTRSRERFATVLIESMQ